MGGSRWPAVVIATCESGTSQPTRDAAEKGRCRLPRRAVFVAQTRKPVPRRQRQAPPTLLLLLFLHDPQVERVLVAVLAGDLDCLVRLPVAEFEPVRHDTRTRLEQLLKNGSHSRAEIVADVDEHD